MAWIPPHLRSPSSSRPSLPPPRLVTDPVMKKWVHEPVEHKVSAYNLKVESGLSLTHEATVQSVPSLHEKKVARRPSTATQSSKNTWSYGKEVRRLTDQIKLIEAKRDAKLAAIPSTLITIGHPLIADTIDQADRRIQMLQDLIRACEIKQDPDLGKNPEPFPERLSINSPPRSYLERQLARTDDPQNSGTPQEVPNISVDNSIVALDQQQDIDQISDRYIREVFKAGLEYRHFTDAPVVRPRTEQEKKEKHIYDESGLVGLDGKLKPPVLNWESRGSRDYDLHDLEHVQHLRRWLDERVQESLGHPYKVDVTNPDFVNGKLPSSGVRAGYQEWPDEIYCRILRAPGQLINYGPIGKYETHFRTDDQETMRPRNRSQTSEDMIERRKIQEADVKAREKARAEELRSVLIARQERRKREVELNRQRDLIIEQENQDTRSKQVAKKHVQKGKNIQITHAMRRYYVEEASRPFQAQNDEQSRGDNPQCKLPTIMKHNRTNLRKLCSSASNSSMNPATVQNQPMIPLITYQSQLTKDTIQGLHQGATSLSAEKPQSSTRIAESDIQSNSKSAQQEQSSAKEIEDELQTHYNPAFGPIPSVSLDEIADETMSAIVGSKTEVKPAISLVEGQVELASSYPTIGISPRKASLVHMLPNAKEYKDEFRSLDDQVQPQTSESPADTPAHEDGERFVEREPRNDATPLQERTALISSTIPKDSDKQDECLPARTQAQSYASQAMVGVLLTPHDENSTSNEANLMNDMSYKVTSTTTKNNRKGNQYSSDTKLNFATNSLSQMSEYLHYMPETTEHVILKCEQIVANANLDDEQF